MAFESTNHLAQETAHHVHGREVWCGTSGDQIWNATNLATMDLYVGIHEYDE